MRLVYIDTNQEVQVGDKVTTQRGGEWEVTYFQEPHKPSSTGKVAVKAVEGEMVASYFVGVIGARWIEREDQRG